jgi:sirohydrochlorin cobaltochelatase
MTDNDPPFASDAIVLFCHGARRPSWREPFERLRVELAQCSGRPVELAFLELMEPDLLTAIERLVDQGRSRLDIVPVFLAPGAHTREDLPALVDQASQRWPGIGLRVRDTLTEDADMRAAIIRWILTS